MRRFDGVLLYFSPREPHVCPVAGFPGQSDHVPVSSTMPATGADGGGDVAKEKNHGLESCMDNANGRVTAAPRRLNRGAAPMLLYP